MSARFQRMDNDFNEIKKTIYSVSSEHTDCANLYIGLKIIGLAMEKAIGTDSALICNNDIKQIIFSHLDAARQMEARTCDI